MHSIYFNEAGTSWEHENENYNLFGRSFPKEFSLGIRKLQQTFLEGLYCEVHQQIKFLGSSGGYQKKEAPV